MFTAETEAVLEAILKSDVGRGIVEQERREREEERARLVDELAEEEKAHAERAPLLVQRVQAAEAKFKAVEAKYHAAAQAHRDAVGESISESSRHHSATGRLRIRLAELADPSIDAFVARLEAEWQHTRSHPPNPVFRKVKRSEAEKWFGPRVDDEAVFTRTEVILATLREAIGQARALKERYVEDVQAEINAIYAPVLEAKQ